MHPRLLIRGLLAASVALAVGAPVVLRTPASAATAKVYDGPDVASYQHPNPTSTYPHGQPIVWKRVLKGGYDFAIVKATEGLTYTNPNFAGPNFNDYADAASVGLVHGAYHFARPSLPIVSSAKSQAKYFFSVVGPVTTEDTLPPALDLEVTGGLTPPQLVTWAQTFLLEMRSLTGRTPMLYTYPNFWTVDLADPEALARYPLWMAAYRTSVAPVADLWQYTSTAHVKGIVGNVDVSKFIGTTGFPWETLSNGTVQTPWKTQAPGPPQSPVATVDGTTGYVTWKPGDTGTARVRRYRVTASPGGPSEVVNGTTFAATFPDLSTGAAYTFTVTGISKVGSGTPSAPTNEITPTVPTVLAADIAPSATFGETVPLHAKLTRADNNEALAGQKVLVFRRYTSSAPWLQIEKLSTDSDGKVNALLHPKRSAQLEVVFPGAPGVQRSTVFKHYVVRPTVTAALSPTTVQHGDAVALTGTVSPFVVGQQIVRENRVDDRWRVRQTTTVSDTGTFAFAFSPARPGDLVMRILAAPTGRRGQGRSDRLLLSVT